MQTFISNVLYPYVVFKIIESYAYDQQWETFLSAEQLLAPDIGLISMKLYKRRMLLMIACKAPVFSAKFSKQGYQNAGQNEAS